MKRFAHRLISPGGTCSQACAGRKVSSNDLEKHLRRLRYAARSRREILPAVRQTSRRSFQFVECHRGDDAGARRACRQLSGTHSVRQFSADRSGLHGPGESSFVQGSATTICKRRVHRKVFAPRLRAHRLFVSVISSLIIAGLWNRPNFRRGRPSRPVVSVPDKTRPPPHYPTPGRRRPLLPPGGAPATSSSELI